MPRTAEPEIGQPCDGDAGFYVDGASKTLDVNLAPQDFPSGSTYLTLQRYPTLVSKGNRNVNVISAPTESPAVSPVIFAPRSDMSWTDPFRIFPLGSRI